MSTIDDMEAAEATNREERAIDALESIAASLKAIVQWPVLVEVAAASIKKDFLAHFMESVMAGFTGAPPPKHPAPPQPVGDQMDVCRCGSKRISHLGGDGPCLDPSSMSGCMRFESPVEEPAREPK